MTPAELEAFGDLLADKVADRLARQPLLVDRYRLSELIGLSVPTIDRRVRAGEIPAIHTGNRVLFDPSAVVAALDRASQDIAIKHTTIGGTNDS